MVYTYSQIGLCVCIEIECVCVCVCVSHSELFGESRDVFLRESFVQSGDMVPGLRGDGGVPTGYQFHQSIMDEHILCLQDKPTSGE